MNAKSLTAVALLLSFFLGGGLRAYVKKHDAKRNVPAGSGDTWAVSFGATSVYNDGTVEPSYAYGPGTDVPIGIAQMPDGGVVVAGQLDLPELGSTNPSGSAADAAIVRYGPTGFIVWEKLLRSSDSSYAPTHVYQVAADANGNVFICGAMFLSGSGANRPFVAKFNSRGTLIWRNGFENANGADTVSPFQTMGLTSDGGVVVGSARGFYVNFYPHAVPTITKFNSDGSIGFHAAYENSIGAASTLAVCQSHDGMHYVALLTPGSSGITDALMVDSNGAIVSQVTYPLNDGRYEVPYQVTATSDGGYAAISRIGDGYGYGRGGVVVRKLNSDLSEQYEKVIRRGTSPGGGGEGLFNPSSIAETNDGGLLIFGSSPVEYRPYKAALMKLDSIGALQFVTVLGGNFDEGSTSQACALCGVYGAAIQMNDGGYAFTTTTFSYVAEPSANHSKPDWWIARTDANRQVANFADVMTDLSVSLFNVTDTTVTPTDTTDFSRIDGYVALTSSQPPFVFENLARNTPSWNIPTVLVQARSPFHGGLTNTEFTVNESESPSGVQPDSILRFAVQQNGIAASLQVRVQSSTTPCDEESWTDLPNGRGARMFFDAASNQFILNTLDYPRQDNIYFRAIASAPGYPDSISNTVPPTDDCPNPPPPGLNLASNTPRLPSTSLFLTANGFISDLYFDAVETSAPNGVALRIQSTTNPDDEFSWTDLNDGNAGHMQRSTNGAYPDDFLLLANNLPSAQGVYYRAIANLSGYVDSISNVMGPFDLKQLVPPNVTIQPPTGLPCNPNLTCDGSANCDGHDACHPILVPAGTFHFSASAQSNRQISVLKLKVDGSTVAEFNGDNGGTDYASNVIGLHLLEAFAIDDQGVSARTGTAPVYIQIMPVAAGGPGAPQVTGKVFTAIHDLGFWDNSSDWRDQDGNPGVPGPDDVAIINANSQGQSRSISFQGSRTVRSLTLNGGVLVDGVGPIDLTVLGTFAVTKGSIQGPIDIMIDDAAKWLLLNSSNVLFTGGGSIHNQGTIIVHGAAGLRGADMASNLGASAQIKFTNPLSIPATAATDPAVAQRGLQAGSVTNSGLLTSDGAGLLTSDGAGLLTSDGAGIISHDGGTLIGHDGAGLLSHDGGSLIGHDGAGLIGHDGAGVIQTGTGPFHPQSNKSHGATGSGGYLQSGGQTDLNSIDIIGPVTLDGGTLSGTGIIQGNLTNNGGTITPGDSAGILGVTGNFTQGANGKLIVEDGGEFPSQFDQVQVGGSANLGGNLIVHLIDGYVPDVEDTFSPLAYDSVNGNFDSVTANAQVMLTPNGLLMAVDPSIPSPPAAPTASAATNVSSYSFVAHWASITGATGYRLDVSTSSSFASYVPGYQNLNAGNATSFVVKTSLHPNTTYYYRLRAYNTGGVSDNSNSIMLTTLPATPTPTPTPKPRPTPGITPTPTPRPSSTPK